MMSQLPFSLERCKGKFILILFLYDEVAFRCLYFIFNREEHEDDKSMVE